MGSAQSQPILAEVATQLPSAILEKAADLISKPGAWTQNVFTRGDSCFCSRGAISVAVGAPRLAIGHAPSEDYLYEVITGERPPRPLTSVSGARIVRWNDDPARTQAEVVEAIRKAAALAREQGQ